jgi:hypothetical protein
MESLLRQIAEDNGSGILAGLERINSKQEEILNMLSAVSESLNNNMNYEGSLFAKEGDENYLDLDHYRTKIITLKKAMAAVNERTQRLQFRLNAIRKDCPTNRNHIVQKGPFVYKCVYKGGVRYREYPSSTAKQIPSKTILGCGEVVEVCERVFINGEPAVFLHVQGVGWLVENKGNIQCMEMTSSPEDLETLNKVSTGSDSSSGPGPVQGHDEGTARRGSSTNSTMGTADDTKILNQDGTDSTVESGRESPLALAGRESMSMSMPGAGAGSSSYSKVQQEKDDDEHSCFVDTDS